MDLEIKVQQRTGEGASQSPVRTGSLLNLIQANFLIMLRASEGEGQQLVGPRTGLKTGFDFKTQTGEGGWSDLMSPAFYLKFDAGRGEKEKTCLKKKMKNRSTDKGAKQDLILCFCSLLLGSRPALLLIESM